MDHTTTVQERIGLRAPLLSIPLVLLLCGFLYSLAGTVIGRMLFPAAAIGSLIERDGRVIGSALVAQPFAAADYFQPRPSAANYDPMAASGSNQARSNPDLRTRIEAARVSVAKRDGLDPDNVPAELMTQSGGGLDPDITPEGARVQIERIARARRLEPEVIGKLVGEMTESPQFLVMGQPRINVLRLNLALDALSATLDAQSAHEQRPR